MTTATTIDGPAPTVTVRDLRAVRESFKALTDASRRAGDAFRGFTDAFSPSIVGLRVVVAPHLLPGPIPDHTEDARRIVRHAMADVTLRGKPVVDPGPKPGERCHAVVRMDTNELWVSSELWDRLQVEAPPPFAQATEPLRSDVYEPVWRARVRAEAARIKAQAVSGVQL